MLGQNLKNKCSLKPYHGLSKYIGELHLFSCKRHLKIQPNKTNSYNGVSNFSPLSLKNMILVYI